MPRKKKEAVVFTDNVKGTQQVIEVSSLAPVLDPPADDLLAEYFRNEDWVTTQEKAFSDHMKPIRDRQEAIRQKLHEKILAEKGQKFSGEHGTAYISNILNTKIDADAAPYTNMDGQVVRGREAILDFALENWDAIGNELLQIGVTKDAVKAWMEQTGQPPPGVSTSFFARVNIRRS